MTQPHARPKCVTGYAEMSNYLPDVLIREESDWFIIISHIYYFVYRLTRLMQ